MTDISVSFCGIRFPNPFILPSGIAQVIPQEHQFAITCGYGGVTTKSLTMEPREGNSNPRIKKVIPEAWGVINSVGLKGPGIVEGVALLRGFIASADVPVIISIFSTNVSDFEQMANRIVPLKPAALELNLSCPNVDGEFGKPLGMGTESAAAAVTAVRKIIGKIPLLAKLTPNIPGIADVARACEASGADGIVAINTVGPGMAIDIATHKPVLGAKMGGVSGRLIKPIAVRCVYEIYEAVKIPIIGMGGVCTAEDAVELMMAGASLVGVGSIIYYKSMKVIGEIRDGFTTYLDENNFVSPSELVGLGHDERRNAL